MSETSIQTVDMSDIEMFEIRVRESVGLSLNNLVMKTILDISNEMPTNMNAIAASYAENLAGRFLKGMELCGDVAAIAFRYEGQMEALKRKEYSTAYLVRAPEKGYKRQKDQEFYAFQDEEYLAACDKAGMAKAFRIMVTQKHAAFEKAHHMMRKLSEHESGGFNESNKISSEGGGLSKSPDDIDWEEALRN